ncbi:hypothetical protein [Streptomyces brasiliensis]|uniref:Knr4/Smi1-like domain-containing protein n=1 Tax=Streptomyces brasiliensis TaxID=1954 RepID=A0A917PDD1_9ACTN|nr:hypothetical protein [Streptomyces brasiliensis]GGJ71623.1 hypothetical protein GCM10010121_097810 [Streptomyces brasiliensis]
MQQEPEPGGPLARLTSLVAPPAAGGNVLDWDSLTERYPRGFPDDYKEFMRVYGQGLFDDFLGVVPPVNEVYPNDPGANVEGVTGDAELTAEEEDYDAPELLIGWGYTVEADLLCWRADSPDPNKWGTVIWRRHWAVPECWSHFNCGMVELLCRFADRDISKDWTFDDLRYTGARFLHARDVKCYRQLRIDPWGADAPPQL